MHTIESAARELGIEMPRTESDLQRFAVQCQTHGVAVNVQDEPFWRRAIHGYWQSRGTTRRSPNGTDARTVNAREQAYDSSGPCGPAQRLEGVDGFIRAARIEGKEGPK